MDALIRPFASLLSFYYALIPSYAVAIVLLTITVMIVLLPLTIKGTRSMLAMQRIGPDIRRLQEKHKNDRQKLNEEVLALYKDNKISPLGGCLPLLLQIPVFLVLYRVIAGLTHKGPGGVAEPKFLSHSSELYASLHADNGSMMSMGIDLAKAATGSHDSTLEAIPYFLLLILMVLLQYVQQWQVSSRAPSVADNPQARQMQIMQKVFPPIFGFISLGFPAGLVLYWVVQNVFRVIQQWAMYRFDPLLKSTVASAHKEAEKFLAEPDSPKATVRRSAKSSSNKKKRKGR